MTGGRWRIETVRGTEEGDRAIVAMRDMLLGRSGAGTEEIRVSSCLRDVLHGAE